MKFSIITPNYNYGNYIAETIESVLRQDYSDFEHIIVDDGSTDDSVSVISSFLEKHPENIILIKQKNQGQTVAINNGLMDAKGDIICWINSDDTFCLGTFSNVSNYFIKHPEIDIVYSDIKVTDVDGNFIYRKRYLDFNRNFGIFFGFANIMSSNAVFFRKSVFEKTGKLNEELKCNMDGEFFSRLTLNGKTSKMKAVNANFRKQPHTKASEKVKDWNLLVKKEIGFELTESYKRTAFSKYIPYKHAWLIKIWFKMYRVFLRFIKMHYFKEFIEKNLYRIKK